MRGATVVLRIAAWSLLLWALLAAASALYWPFAVRHSYLGAGYNHDRRTIFVNDLQATVYELGRACPLPPKRRVVVLGGSGARAFKPELLTGVLGSDEVVNVALNYSNFTQIRQVVQDLHACIGDDGMRASTFVLVPSLFSFVDTQLRFEGPYTAYEAEKLRFHLFAGPPGAVVPLMAPESLRAAIDVWRPVLLMRKVLFKAQRTLEAAAARLHRIATRGQGGGPMRREDFLAAAERLMPEAREAFAPEQSAELRRLIADIRASGARLVIAEQPTQQWLREQAPLFPASHALFQQVAAEAGVPYIDLSASAGDGEFKNAVHASHAGVAKWNERLAAALRAIPSS